MIDLNLILPLAQEQTPAPTESMTTLLGAHLIAALLFAVLGIVIFFVGLFLVEKLTPVSITKEIIEEHNQAVAMIVSAIVVGISIIIGAAILG